MKKNKPVSNRRSPAKNGVPRWKHNLDRYRSDELSYLVFSSDADMYAAIELVWVGRLQGVPFQFGGDGDSLLVPKKAIPYFSKAGLRFTRKLAS